MRISLVEETVFEAWPRLMRRCCRKNGGEGIAVVDIGAQSTEMVVYYGDAMHLASNMKICGDHFTRDLAQGLCLRFEDAELVKLEYGSALAESSAENAMVDLPTPENREHRATRSAASSTRSCRRAPRSCSSFVRAELAARGHGACARSAAYS